MIYDGVEIRIRRTVAGPDGPVIVQSVRRVSLELLDSAAEPHEIVGLEYRIAARDVQRTIDAEVLARGA